MKRYFIIIFILFFSIQAYTQNLVPNGSFNKCTNCPVNAAGQFIHVKDWLGMIDLYLSVTAGQSPYPQQVGTTEYYHTCGKGISNIPGSPGLGNKRPRTGKGMAGMIFNEWDNNELSFYREWITVPLTDTLQKDSLYCVSYYVRKTNTYTTNHWQKWNMSTNTFTATFTADTLIGEGFPIVQWWPASQVVYNDSLIRDTAHWSRISGSFKAQGDEAYLTIGAGLPNDKIKVEPDTMWNWAFYLVDDVAVWKCSEKAKEAEAGSDRTICRGENTQLGKHNLKQYHYLWFKKGNLKDTLCKKGIFHANPKSTTTYLLQVKDFKYDITWDSVTVNVKPDCLDPEIPNVITPNGDGYNDVFKPELKYDIRYEFSIYNRWGKLIYSGDENHPWDGKINGRKVSEGVYYYVLKAHNPVTGYEKEYSGEITVIF